VSAVAAWVERPSDARISFGVLALSIGGVVFVLLQIILGSQMGLFPIPPGDTLIWDRVGDGLRAGNAIYFRAEPLSDSFWYAPPWAVAFAAISWLPPWALHLLFVAVKIASLRFIAGSWVGVGIAGWFPLVAYDLASGSFNLLMAAAIVAAVRGHPHLAVLSALAKFGPILAVDPRRARTVALVLVASFAVTLPWLRLWPEWVAQIVGNLGVVLGLQIPISLPIRWGIAAALLALRRPWSRALAAAIAIPAFYWGSIVVLIAPVAVALRGDPKSGAAAAAQAAAAQAGAAAGAAAT
jgi:hypothetical protein